MISPEAIPRIDGDMVALVAHADALTGTGIAIADIGARVHQTWQGLATVYIAPEADQLLAATGPVMSVSASAGEDIEGAASAIRIYAADTADVQAHLETLRTEATAVVTAYAAAQSARPARAKHPRQHPGYTHHRNRRRAGQLHAAVRGRRLRRQGDGGGDAAPPTQRQEEARWAVGRCRQAGRAGDQGTWRWSRPGRATPVRLRWPHPRRDRPPGHRW